ncbi:MAG: hypothetical protein ABSE95_07815 [Thermodesulfobacteriota bacterium]|jgi:hypothetical protein
MNEPINRLLKKAHLLRYPYPSPPFGGAGLLRYFMYASFLRIAAALYLDLFEQPEQKELFSILFRTK